VGVLICDGDNVGSMGYDDNVDEDGSKGGYR